MNNTWEYFLDESYYDMWAVRPEGEKRWGNAFHLNSRQEAMVLAEILTKANVPSPFGK